MKLEYKHIYLLALPVLIFILTLNAFTTLPGNKDEGKQGNQAIIKFSHTFHSGLAECTQCHSKAAESKTLTDKLLPTHEECGSCHNVEDTEQCSTCHIDDNFEPLIQHTSDMIFDHSFHVGAQQMKCEDCHQGLNDVDYSFQAVQPFPKMATCYSCHNENTIATNACEACHTSTSDLKPVSHRTVDFKLKHKFAAKMIDANCVMCHDSNNNSCENCHTATRGITEDNSTDGFYQPYAPNNFVDGSKVQKITRVHDLNYRFSHGIDAQSKQFDCTSCHEIETFCGDCHQSKNGDFALGGIMPTSHLLPNFVGIGSASVGNDHGIIARRDIESCASCHDTQGGDPTCITCHTDADGIKGTNPRTHPAGFRSDQEGDWHESPSSVCYNCHTSSSPSSAPGLGFCGYCHGAN